MRKTQINLSDTMDKRRPTAGFGSVVAPLRPLVGQRQLNGGRKKSVNWQGNLLSRGYNHGKLSIGFEKTPLKTYKSIFKTCLRNFFDAENLAGMQFQY